MKQILLYLLGAWLLLASACADDHSAPVNQDCGKTSSALCYAHTWTEFSSLNNLSQGDAVYTHEYFNKNGSSVFIYKVNLKNVCEKANLEIDLTNTVKLGPSATYVGDLYINGDHTTIIMNNLNGIISGHLNKTLSGFPITSLEIYNTIIIPNLALGFTYDTTWYHNNVSSHGIEAKFQIPK